MGFAPLPQPSTDLTDKPGQARINTLYAQWFAALDALTRAFATAGGAVAFLLVTTGQTIQNGFQWQATDLGTLSGGSQSITPNPSAGLKQKVTNNVGGANTLTINATSQIGDVELVIVNGASPGTVTFAGFSKQFTGDTPDQTSGHAFVVFIYGLAGGFSAVIVKALQ